MAVDWNAYVKEIEDQMVQIKELREAFEDGSVTLRSRLGNGAWRDVTA